MDWAGGRALGAQLEEDYARTRRELERLHAARLSASPQLLTRMVNVAMRRLRLDRCIFGHRLRERPGDYLGGLGPRSVISLELEMVPHGPNGERIRYHELSRDELEMDGPRALLDWLDRVDMDARTIAAQHQNMTATEVQERHRQQMVRMAEFAAFPLLVDMGRLTELLLGTNEILGDMIWGGPKFSKEAEDRARELFKAAAGQECYDTLERGCGWPLEGSAGGQYWLYKRASFCVEDRGKKVSLCAVVPKVPLYDHLLGIKLTIEHDEPEFLRTANVAHINQSAHARAMEQALIYGHGVARIQHAEAHQRALENERRAEYERLRFEVRTECNSATIGTPEDRDRWATMWGETARRFFP